MQTRVISRIADIPASAWNAVAGTDHPFTRHEFLAALERHDCVGERFGWFPCHILAADDKGRLSGAVPFYLKDNSYGEFVFDWAWADAWRQMGLQYYPKLLTAIPFTPATGPRLLHDPALEKEHHNDQRRRRDERRGGNLAPGHRMFALEKGNPHRHSLLDRIGDDQKGQEELVPRIDKGQDGGRKKPWR